MNQIGLLESGVIRGLLVALGSLLGLVVTKLGYTFDDAFYAQLVDAVLMLLIAGSTLYAAWMRARKPTPPITNAAVLATKERQITEHLQREGGRANIGHLAMVAALSVLTACALLGGASAKTFNERLAVGYSTVTGVRQVATSLVQSDAITADDAANIQRQADVARAGLDVAAKLQTVDLKSAEARLTSTLQILHALEDYLRSRHK